MPPSKTFREAAVAALANVHVSLHPLSFEEAITILLNAKPNPQKKRAAAKSKTRKK